MAKSALLIIDIQNDYFDGGKWPLFGAADALAQAKRLLDQFRRLNYPIIHVRHEFQDKDAPFFVAGSEGATIHQTMKPEDGEIEVLKHQVNSFQDTELKQILDDLEVTSLVVVGSMSHMCIDAAVRAAADFGYQVTVAEDACATLDMSFNGIDVPANQVHATYMAALAFAYAEVTDTDSVLKNFKE